MIAGACDRRRHTTAAACNNHDEVLDALRAVVERGRGGSDGRSARRGRRAAAEDVERGWDGGGGRTARGCRELDVSGRTSGDTQNRPVRDT